MTDAGPHAGQLRLFTAVELPHDWLFALANARGELERTGGREFRWVNAELMHLTIVFLGDQDPDALPAISAALRDVAGRSRSFGISLGSLGSFGPPHGLTVLWAGLAEVPSRLSELHAGITQGLADKGIVFDQRPLVPHITMARGRRQVNREASLRVFGILKRLALPRLIARVNRFVLFRSHLGPAGPAYETLESFQIGGEDGT